MKSNNKNLIIGLLSFGGIVLLLTFLEIRICPFFHLFKIPCPGCGLTRSILLLFQGKILESINYNILGIPIVIISLIYLILLIFKKTDKLNIFLNKYKIILIVLAVIITIIVEIININNPLLY